MSICKATFSVGECSAITHSESFLVLDSSSACIACAVGAPCSLFPCSSGSKFEISFGFSTSASTEAFLNSSSA